MENWRQGESDVGPDRTERSDLSPTYTMIRTCRVGVVISTGPIVQPFVLPAKDTGK